MTIADLLGCGSEKNEREKDDFYSTPNSCTIALCEAEQTLMPKNIWEPCSGTGAIADVLIHRGHKVIETDLVNRGREECKSRIDFLMERKPLATAIITNPPFKLAEDFVRHAGDIGVNYLALLLKADFLHSASRYELFHSFWRPSRIYGLSWRPDFTGQDSPTMNCSWFIWESFSNRLPIFTLLPKP